MRVYHNFFTANMSNYRSSWFTQATNIAYIQQNKQIIPGVVSATVQLLYT